MWTLIFGLILLGLAFGDTAWKLMGWAPHADEAPTTASLRRWIKLFASLGGFLLLFIGFPSLPSGVSNPGWVCVGTVMLVLGGWEGMWKQEMFLGPCRDDYNNAIGYGMFRIIAVILGALALGAGVGTGYPSWSTRWQAETNAIQVEQLRSEGTDEVVAPTK